MRGVVTGLGTRDARRALRNRQSNNTGDALRAVL